MNPSNAKHCAEASPDTIYTDPSNSPVSSSLCRCGNRDPERLSYLPKVTELGRGASGLKPTHLSWVFGVSAPEAQDKVPHFDTRAGNPWKFHSKAVACPHQLNRCTSPCLGVLGNHWIPETRQRGHILTHCPGLPRTRGSRVE